MTLHIIKLCVGIDRVSELADWQAERLRERCQAGEAEELFHITRQMPKRASEILPDGSLYWVIKGHVIVRQRLLELRPVVRDGLDHCAFILDHSLIVVESRPRRPFQGWRYLEEEDAPPDTGRFDGAGDRPLPQELIDFGLR